MTEQMEGQLTWSDLGLHFGRMSPEPLAATEEKISVPSSKNLSRSPSRKPPRCLRLIKTDGPTPTASWETDGALLTEFSMLNTGESPSGAVESTLSSILLANVPERYYLSAKACEGILRRAERRGKELPPMLKIALEQQMWRDGRAYLSNKVCEGVEKSVNTFQNTGQGWWNESPVGATVRTPCGGDSVKSNLVVEKNQAVRVRYIVRRLTPTECARLQGFPDKWGRPDHKVDFTDEEYRFWMEVRNTNAAINGKAVKEYTKEQMLKWYNGLHTDSAEYKMWGNGIALPPALYVMQGIAEVMQ